jgi:hypothetical protein
MHKRRGCSHWAPSCAKLWGWRAGNRGKLLDHNATASAEGDIWRARFSRLPAVTETVLVLHPNLSGRAGAGGVGVGSVKKGLEEGGRKNSPER